MNKNTPSCLSAFRQSGSHRASLAALAAALSLGSLPATGLAGAPPPVPGAAILTSLFSFNGTNGSMPMGQLAQAADGTLYGTTSTGGTNGGFGTIFKLSGGTVTSLFSFNNTNGDQPETGLLLASDGNFYGTAHLGGTNLAGSLYNLGYGTLFRFATNGVFTSLASFNGTNGSLPNNLVQAADGFFYGLAQEGGSYTNSDGLTSGTVFKSDLNGNITPLLDFNGTNGANPITGLTLSTNGTLYGVTILATLDASVQTGTAFQVTTNGNLTVLDYLNQTNGNQPESLIAGIDGNFYGVCAYGGAYGYGTVFQLQPNGNLTTLVSFNVTNGAEPMQLIQGRDGYLYGVTSSGGSNGFGTVFQCATNGGLTTLYSFAGAADGSGPVSIMQAKDGSFYGVTTYGGTNGDGSLFKLTVAPRPDILSFAVKNGIATINFTAANGLSYNLQRRATLNLNTWTNVATISTTGSVGVATDAIGTNKLGFYRIALAQ